MFYNYAAAAATAAVQTLSKVQQPAGPPQHKLTMPTFWVEDPAGWFQHAEAEYCTLSHKFRFYSVLFIHGKLSMCYVKFI